MPLPDIVYVVRESEDNEALRYSLRSLVHLPHGKVFMSGYTPSWVRGVVSINREQDHAPDLANSNTNLYAALIQPDLSDDFIVMNDDFFIMEPVESIPVLHQGSLDARIAAYRTDNRFEQAYSLIRTKEWLEKNGYSSLLSYELHMPMVYNRQKLLQVFHRWQPYPLFTLRPRTCYGNVYHLNGQEVNDAKDSTNKEDVFISAGRDFNTSYTGQFVRSHFTNPSTYES